MSDSLTYQPLTLKKNKDGHSYGEVTSHNRRFRVRSTSLQQGATVRVAIAEVGVGDNRFRPAGYLRKQGVGRYVYYYLAADGTTITGYEKQGRMSESVETVVHSHVSALEFAAKEAAKTPEERAAEAQARLKAAGDRQRREIEKASRDLMDLVDRYVDADALVQTNDRQQIDTVASLRLSLDRMTHSLATLKMTAEKEN